MSQRRVGDARLPAIVSARDVSWIVPLVTVAVAATVAIPPTVWHAEGHDDGSSEEDGSKDQIGEESDVRHVEPPWSLVVRRRRDTALHDERGAASGRGRVGRGDHFCERCRNGGLPARAAGRQWTEPEGGPDEP